MKLRDFAVIDDAADVSPLEKPLPYAEILRVART